MKIILVSDTHGREEKLKGVLKKTGKPDAVFHMGDSERGQEYMENVVGCPLYMVRGNCDYGISLPEKLVVDMGGHRFYISHGDREWVNSDLIRLRENARMNNADVALFGHTHKAVIDYNEGITAVNPGSLTQPRPWGSDPTYILMEIDDKGELHFSINNA